MCIDLKLFCDNNGGIFVRGLKQGDRGPKVKELQALLKKIGYDPGTIDGIFGSNTKDAISKYQQNNNIPVTGMVDDKTYEKLMPLALGYREHTIKEGDRLWKLARDNFTTVNRIVTANPGLNPYDLIIGETIVIPYGINVVDTDIDYTYEVLEQDIKGLKARYPFLEVDVIGESVLGKKLYVLKLGKGPDEVFYNATHHGLEWITSPTLMKWTEEFLKNYTDGTSMKGYDPKTLWNESTIYIMPMVNPDGVDLVLNGLSRDNPYYNDLIKWNNGSTDFSQNWQANIRGVDLNHNYPAKWETSKRLEEEMGITGPGPTRYGGEFPLSEPETQAVVDFVKDHDFRLVLAYHTQGEVIYWQFENMQPPEAKTIGDMFADVSGYRLDSISGIGSYAGMKDWFIQEYRRPGYTIEAGKGKNPLPISQFPKIYSDNEELLLLAATV